MRGSSEVIQIAEREGPKPLLCFWKPPTNNEGRRQWWQNPCQGCLSVTAPSFFVANRHFAKWLEQLCARPVMVICGMDGWSLRTWEPVAVFLLKYYPLNSCSSRWLFFLQYFHCKAGCLSPEIWLHDSVWIPLRRCRRSGALEVLC